MIALIVLVALGANGPGPLDAFRANYASIKVDTEFALELGLADRAAIVSGALWSRAPLALTEYPERRVLGRWECDGTAEHLVYWPAQSQDHVVEDNRGFSAAILPVEILLDGESAAYHILSEPDEGTLHVVNSTNPPFLSRGPFSWIWAEPFPRSLIEGFSGIEPVLKTATRGGHFTEVAIYRDSTPGGWVQAEISYDPSVGYLPRYARLVSFGNHPTLTFVKEMYLVEARSCTAGGFVPVQWYETLFDFDDFARRYPNYDDETELRPTQSKVVVRHYRTTKFEDRSAPVVLDQLENVRVISGIGGQVPLARPPATLTLSAAKSLLGWEKLNVPLGPSLNIDHSEVYAFDHPPRRSYQWYWIGGSSVLLAVVGAWGWRKYRAGALVLLAAVVGGSGCQHEPSGPVAFLSGSFKQSRFIYASGKPWFQRTLVLNNEGNHPIRIFGVSGGCSCRWVDQSQLPAMLAPGDRLELDVQLQDRKHYDPQTVEFSCETDTGVLPVRVTLHALPSHRFIPEAITIPALDEDEEGAFDLVLRRVIPPDGNHYPDTIHFPPRFDATEAGVRTGRVVGFEGVSFEDTTYQVTLKDRSLGLHKDIIRLTGDDGSPLGEVHAVWKRVSFLSSAPDRVFLGARPIRVFLRCPDERIELTRILSAPEGVKAVVSSVRELTVMLDDEAPGIIDGMIEVGTTAEDRPPLRVPVVRYAPTLAQNPDAG